MHVLRHLLLPLGLAWSFFAAADEAVIRKNLAQRLPHWPPLDEVRKTPVPGIWEVRLGNEVRYTDAEGAYVFEGELIDVRTKTNLTRERVKEVTAFKFEALALKDALVIKQGKGSRRIAVFADPNCGPCKLLEQELRAVSDVTIYTFVYPILGPDSDAKARDIWCAKEPGKVWRDWMVGAVPPARAMGRCELSALERNLAFGRKYAINGTPAIVFEDGERVASAMSRADLSKRLDATKKPKS
jgi:thiol:disulfide interchange protein DsbC